MTKETVCVKIVVRGIVQGIGFRWFVRDIAEEEGILGYVKNNIDGSVEIVAKAKNSNDFKKFLERIKTEYPYAVINDIELTPIDLEQDYKNFSIKF
jgi:acylphosphatase